MTDLTLHAGPHRSQHVDQLIRQHFAHRMVPTHYGSWKEVLDYVRESCGAPAFTQMPNSPLYQFDDAAVWADWGREAIYFRNESAAMMFKLRFG